MAKNKSEHPCTDCPRAVNDYCGRHGKYKVCGAWQMWFRRQWRELQKIFGVDVSKRHEEKGDDDNENT